MTARDPQQELSAELLGYLYREMEDKPPGRVCWVMNREWHAEVRRLCRDDGYPLWRPGIRFSDPECLFGIPVDVRDDAGVPTLEPDPERCYYCHRPAVRQSQVDYRWLCAECRPCWCDYCDGRVGTHGPDAVALHQQQISAWQQNSG